MAIPKNQANKAEKTEPPFLPKFKVDDVEYVFVNDRCILPGNRRATTKEMINEPATLENLVAIKSGIIRLVEKSK